MTETENVRFDSLDLQPELQAGIDAAGFEARADELPVDPGNYRALYAVDGKLVYASSSLVPVGSRPSMSVEYYDIEDRSKTTESQKKFTRI